MDDDQRLLEEYARLRSARGFDWGEEFSQDPDDLARMLPALAPGAPGLFPVSTLSELAERLGRNSLPAGFVLIDIGDDTRVIRSGPALALAPLSIRPSTLIVRNSSKRALRVRWGSLRRTIDSGSVGGLVRMLSAKDEPSVRLGSGTYPLPGLVDRVDAGFLCLRGDAPFMWSVCAEDGTWWFPEGELPHWSADGTGWFVTTSAVIGLPPGTYEVSSAHTLEGMLRSGRVVRINAGGTADLVWTREAAPPRSVADGDPFWASADLHVHRNYSRTDVVDLTQAQLLQDAVQLDVMALVAGNVHTSHVFDHTLLDRAPATTPAGRLTLFGAEFRNDFYGHLIALGSMPSGLYSGHPHSDHPLDDLTPASVARQVRASGGVAIAAHPFWAPLADELPAVDDRLRSVEAVYLPVLAALAGLDAVEMLSPGHTPTVEGVVHRLFDCGFEFALVAGTDTFMSFSAGPTSQPPGDAMCQIALRGAPRGAAVLDGIRRRETVVSRRADIIVRFSQDGRPVRVGGRAGTTVAPLVVEIEVRSEPAMEVELRSAGGRAWRLDLDEGRYQGLIPAEAATWVAVRAVAADGADSYFHTTPVFLDDTDEDAREVAARWALAWIERLRLRVHRAGHGTATELRCVYDELDEAMDAFTTMTKGRT